MLVESRFAADRDSAAPGAAASRSAAGACAVDMPVFAMFTTDLGGCLASWGLTAEALFGHTANQVLGRHVCDVLMRGEHRAATRDALAEIAAGRAWTTVVNVTCADGSADEIAFRWEPSAGTGPPTEALVLATRAPARGHGLLSEAATRIGSTLDLAHTAREVVGLAVPAFADAAGVFLPERLMTADEFAWQAGDRPVAVRRLAASLACLSRRACEEMFRAGEVLVFNADTPYVRCMAANTPFQFDRLDGETAQRISGFAGGPELVSSYTSFLAVPLAARGAVVGCAVFARTKGGPGFAAADVTLAVGLAARAAVCIDNARLYSRERRTALALQRSLLPGNPAVPAGLEVAHRYLPVGANIVGGDWYDIIELSCGRAALVVGDAMGHGPEAAAIMIQLRTAARTLAGLELPPEQVLGRLDTMAADMAGTPFATCIYAILDPADGACVVARAGHLPPVVAAPCGTPKVLDLPVGLPLGLGSASFEASHLTIPPGATIALYTDGLVESRTQSFDHGVSALCAALARSAGPLSEICDAITRELCEDGEDDVTLVLARAQDRQRAARSGMSS